METKETEEMETPPLSEEETAAWENLVAEGRAIRAPRLEAKAARSQANKAAYLEKAAAEGRKAVPRVPNGRSDSMTEIPVRAKRWVVSRYAGLSFRKAGEASGASWVDVQDAKARSEEFRCAFDAMEESSRQLMKAKAQSIVEQSQEEGSRVSMAQTQVSMRILASLDRGHFGEERVRPEEDGGAKALGAGGFVIRMVADAAKAAEETPKARTGKALVYADV